MQAQQGNNQFVRNMASKSMGYYQLGNIRINRFKYDKMGYDQLNEQGRRYMGADGLIDCSGLVSNVLQENRYRIPTQTTLSMYYNYQKYFDKVDPAQARPGDIAVWRFKRSADRPEEGHTGFIVQLDPTSGKMTYYGSQSSTGPAMATNTKGILKDREFIILRPKQDLRKI